MTEKWLQNKVINYFKKLESQGYKIFWEKRQAGGFNYRIGLPDVYFVINGRHYEIELKKPGVKIEYKSEQLLWFEKLNHIGIETIISNNYNEIIEFINSKLEEKEI